MRKNIIKVITKLFKSTSNKQQTKNEPIEEKVVAEEYERCVICGSLTSVPVSMPIDWRENYEIGFGQLCCKCASGQQKPLDTLTNEQIIFAVKQSREKKQ